MLLDYPAYPSWKDVEASLKSNSIWPTDANLQQFARKQADTTARAAAAQFEKLTGWGPTLAERIDAENPVSDLAVETRFFDGGDHNGDLNLQSGLLRLDSVSINGTLQTRDYTPYFKRYTRDPSSPIIALRSAFGSYGAGSGIWGGYASSWGGGGGNRIAITGVWGLFLRVPADVYEVCLHKAIANMMDYVYNQQSIGSISQDGFSESFDITGVRTQQNIAETGAKGFNTLCLNYQRPVF